MSSTLDHFDYVLILFFFFFWLCHTACGILIPRPGIKPTPTAVEAWCINYWTTREIPSSPFFKPLLSSDPVSLLSFSCPYFLFPWGLADKLSIRVTIRSVAKTVTFPPYCLMGREFLETTHSPNGEVWPSRDFVFPFPGRGRSLAKVIEENWELEKWTGLWGCGMEGQVSLLAPGCTLPPPRCPASSVSHRPAYTRVLTPAWTRVEVLVRSHILTLQGSWSGWADGRISGSEGWAWCRLGSGPLRRRWVAWGPPCRLPGSLGKAGQGWVLGWLWVGTSWPCVFPGAGSFVSSRPAWWLVTEYPRLHAEEDGWGRGQSCEEGQRDCGERLRHPGWVRAWLFQLQGPLSVVYWIRLEMR